MTILRRRENRSVGQDQLTYGLHEVGLPPVFFPVKTKYEMIQVIIIIIIIINFTLVQAAMVLRGSRGMFILFL
jgi:hypothetical protein